MSETTPDIFRQTLEQIARLAGEHPEYRFEHIHSYTSQLTPTSDSKAWISELEQQWRELPAPRQEACQQIFDYALLRARQTTYRPVNALDAFLERQLYGIEDDQIVHKGSVSQALRSLEERKRPPAPPPAPQPAPPASAGRPQAAGRTNPLSPRHLPKGPDDKV